MSKSSKTPSKAGHVTVVRDSKNGQFVKPSEAVRRPATTETEHYKR